MASIILRPNANGDVNNGEQYPTSGEHWDKVDEVTADGDTTYLSTPTNSGSNREERFEIENATQSGVIDSVKVYVRAKTLSTSYPGTLYIAVKTHEKKYTQNVSDDLTGAYKTLSHTWTVNPYTNQPWTWEEVNNLLIGFDFRSGVSEENKYHPIFVTQVYVEVNYRKGKNFTTDSYIAVYTTNLHPPFFGIIFSHYILPQIAPPHDGEEKNGPMYSPTGLPIIWNNRS